MQGISLHYKHQRDIALATNYSKGKQMTKSELKETAKITAYHQAGLGIDYVARSLSALIRAARNVKSQHEIFALAVKLNADQHPEFII